MSYFGTAFKELCRDPDEEAARAQVWVRLKNGHNLLTRSAEHDHGDWTTLDLAVSLGSTVLALDGAGVSYKLAQNGTSVQANITQVSPVTVYARESSMIVSIVAHGMDGGGSSLSSNLTAFDGVTSCNSVFDWTAGVPALGTNSGNIRGAGAVDLGGGWYRLAISIDFANEDPAYPEAGRVWTYRFFPNYGNNTDGNGVYASLIQMEVDRTAPEILYPTEPGGYVTTEDAAVYGKIGTALDITGDHEVLSLNPIEVKREREYGVMESQDWQVAVTNMDLDLNDYDLYDCWIALLADFQSNNEDAVVAQGRVYRVISDTEGRFTIGVKDAVRQLLEDDFPADRYLRVAGWAGSIEPVNVDSDSQSYDNDWDEMDGGVEEGGGIGSVTGVDEGYMTITFVSATTYDVAFPDGTTLGANQALSIAADEDVVDGSANILFVIKGGANGWDQTGGAYATGDVFQFPASWGMDSGDLNPMTLVTKFLKESDYMGMEIINVQTALPYSSPLYDDAGRWTAALSTYASTTINARVSAGDNYIDIIQKLLKLIHASIYTMPNGQLGLWELKPVEESAIVLNGDLVKGKIDILKGRVIDDAAWLANVVTYTYLTLGDQAEASITVTDDESVGRNGPHRTIEDFAPLEIDSASVTAYANQLLNRKKAKRRSYELLTNMAGVVIDMDQAIAVIEPDLKLDGVVCMIAGTKFDIISNTGALLAYVEEGVLDDYWRIGDATTDPVGSQVGGTDKIW